MPGVGTSSGGGTETTSFGSWDQGANEPYFEIQLDLDTRPGSYAHENLVAPNAYTGLTTRTQYDLS